VWKYNENPFSKLYHCLANDTVMLKTNRYSLAKDILNARYYPYGFTGNVVIVIYIRERDVNFPARQLVSGTMAQPSA
jgi:hypothetical protein